MSDRNKWVQKILELQHEDGSWGFFHSLSQPTKEQPMTTEQALRRLQILGLTAADEPIRRALNYIEGCLNGQNSIPDRAEKQPDWGLFVEIILSTWLKIFIPEHEQALSMAERWAEVINKTFAAGSYDQSTYEQAYRDILRPQGKKVHYFKRFINYYPLMLLQGMLKPEIEGRMLEHVLNWPEGIYYISSCPLNKPPAVFASRETSRYIAMLEILSGYSTAPDKLDFAVRWLKSNRDENGQWDLGPQANDGLYFPLSDSWRRAASRRADCTARIEKLLKSLGQELTD
jgi:hypothetical protein